MGSTGGSMGTDWRPPLAALEALWVCTAIISTGSPMCMH